MKTEIYDIEGMHCAACSSAIERVTRKLEGVSSSDVNLPMNRLTISYDESLVDCEKICAKIKRAGFGAHLHTEKEEIKPIDESSKLKGEKSALIASIILSFILLYVSMGQMLFENIPMPSIFSMHAHPTNFAILQMLLAISVMFLEKRFFISGFTSLFHGNPNMDTLVAISASVSFLYSLVMTLFIDSDAHAVHNLYFESAAIVLALVSVGKYLESRNKVKTKGAIAKLMELSPPTAILVDENGQWEVPIEKLKLGDTVLVKAGMSVPLDGRVTKGSGSANESMLTGESLPVEKGENSEVIGGSILLSGAIYIEITAMAENTVLAKIIKFVEDAQGKKAPIAKLADKVAGVFVPVIIAIATLSAIIWLILGYELTFALKIFTCVLVIACPCSLGLATPTSIIVGTGLGASKGILIRNGEALEKIHNIDMVIFDKTGTITEGKPVVTDILSPKYDENQFLQKVISIEKLSSHPLAKAICDEENHRDLDVTAFTGEFETLDGFGIVSNDSGNYTLAIGNMALMEKLGISITNTNHEALSSQGKTLMFVAENNEFIGYIGVADKIKETSREAILNLKNMGIKTLMLTGDNEKTAAHIAKEVGVDNFIAGVLPTEKASVVEKYQAENYRVMMVGDGINDAPALTQGDVGCAIGGGSDIAIESAEIILMKDDLRDVPKAIKLSHHTLTNIKENLFWAFCYNCLCVPVAAGVLYPSFGILLSPMIGGLAMSLSSLFVVSNALRLRGKKL